MSEKVCKDPETHHYSSFVQYTHRSRNGKYIYRKRYCTICKAPFYEVTRVGTENEPPLRLGDL